MDAANFNSRRSLDEYEAEIFQLYIRDKKSLKDVIREMNKEYGLDETEPTFNAKLREWKMSRNARREDVFKILQDGAKGCFDRRRHVFIVDGRPVHIDQVKKFCQRERIVPTGRKTVVALAKGNALLEWMFSTAPNSPVSSLFQPILDRLLNKAAIYAKQGFESKAWVSDSTELLILSSPNQESEKTALHGFLTGLDTGCTRFNNGERDVGGVYWRKAFRESEVLVKGRYHDNIPNMLQKMNDLNDSGFAHVAESLMKYISRTSSQHPSAIEVQTSFFNALADVDIGLLTELEALVMAAFVDLFYTYLPPRSYNSFVMRMNLARRDLRRGGKLDECVPKLEDFDKEYGCTNRRSMDIILLRTEVLFERASYSPAEQEATTLVDRARRLDIEQQLWLLHYYHVHGFSYMYKCQYHNGDYHAARVSAESCLYWIHEFEAVDVENTEMFHGEKMEVLDCRKNIARAFDDHNIATASDHERYQVLEQVLVLDDVFNTPDGLPKELGIGM